MFEYAKTERKKDKKTKFTKEENKEALYSTNNMEHISLQNEMPFKSPFSNLSDMIDIGEAMCARASAW